MRDRKMRGWKMGDNRVWKACLRISVPKLMLEYKNDIGFSSLDTVVALFVLYLAYLCVFCVCFLLSLWTYFSEF